MGQADKARKRLHKKLGREPTGDEIDKYIARKNRKRKASEVLDGEDAANMDAIYAAAGAGADAGATEEDLSMDEEVRLENARAVCKKPLPPPPGEALRKDSNGNLPTTITLFYQYVEPCWTKKEFKKALATIINLGREHGITGRGRCSPEGLNCTLTASAQASRDYCNALRKWNPIFEETDFKFTDGLPYERRFKAFTVRKTEELVAYGLGGDKAPVLSISKAEHLEADQYHKFMEQPDTVIIDVRNKYESDIGHFQPPDGGAKLLLPPMRNSHEFPKWLNAPETRAELQGKNVMMYCTGGIRCERATALLDQMTAVDRSFKTGKVVMARGGIDRYIKTFPDGGYWKGKNFLFDRRFEQVAENKEDLVESEAGGHCCLCKTPCSEYRGAHKCINVGCRVPVIVCPGCQDKAKATPSRLNCPLCQEDFQLRDLPLPDLKGQRVQRMAEEGLLSADEAKKSKRKKASPSTRVFLGRLPLTVNLGALKRRIEGEVTAVQWITDRNTGLFYGSCFVQMAALADAQKLVEREMKINDKKIRINFSPVPDDTTWPPEDFEQLERPPVPV